jgi:hypothetical protein
VRKRFANAATYEFHHILKMVARITVCLERHLLKEIRTIWSTSYWQLFASRDMNAMRPISRNTVVHKELKLRIVQSAVYVVVCVGIILEIGIMN